MRKKELALSGERIKTMRWVCGPRVVDFEYNKGASLKLSPILALKKCV